LPVFAGEVNESLNQKRLKLLCDVLDIIRLVTQHKVDQTLLKDLDALVDSTLKRWQVLAPVMEQHLVFHHLRHIPSQLGKYGSTRCFWMFGFERLFAFFNRCILNRCHIEANLLSVWRYNFLSGISNLFMGQLLAGEKRYQEEFVFPYHKPRTIVCIDPAQLKHCLVRCSTNLRFDLINEITHW